MHGAAPVSSHDGEAEHHLPLQLTFRLRHPKACAARHQRTRKVLRHLRLANVAATRRSELTRRIMV